MNKYALVALLTSVCSVAYAQIDKYHTSTKEVYCAKHNDVASTLRKLGEEPTIAGMEDGKIVVIWVNPTKHTATVTIAKDGQTTCLISVLDGYDFLSKKR